MPSPTEICNIAIVDLRGDPISDIDSVTERNAIVCKARYATARDFVLRSHPWNCAEEFFSLAAAAGAPPFGYDHWFNLPADPYCLRVLRLEDVTVRWRVRGRKLLADASGPLKGVMIARVTEDRFDAMLAEAIAYRLGLSIAYRLTQQRSEALRMEKLYKDIVAQARSADAQEAGPEDEEPSSFEAARA